MNAVIGYICGTSEANLASILNKTKFKYTKSWQGGISCPCEKDSAMFLLIQKIYDDGKY